MDVPRGASLTVTLKKEGTGLGFSLEGGKDSPYGDRPMTVKKIFTGTSTSLLQPLLHLIPESRANFNDIIIYLKIISTDNVIMVNTITPVLPPRRCCRQERCAAGG